ncbi:alpha-galactosidase [Chitinophaga costaii]|nr:alpha-galactosidase [Chitinophaga costaii]
MLAKEGLCTTPPMGWNSWNFFEGRISDTILRQMGDAMVANGMKAAGYEYIIIDDLWTGGRDAQNNLVPDAVRFPHGMKALADYLHARGLKLGIYSDAAMLTCGGVTGSYNFEEQDAATFASWGIDYLKYDYCNAPQDVSIAFARYKKMGDALKATGRPIVYAICEWGQLKPWLWARAAGGNLWRTTWDLRDVWQSHNDKLTGILEVFDQEEHIAQYAGPGGWNDPDMLMVGLNGKGSSSSAGNNGVGCTPTEYAAHFALWCMLAAPLVVNSDLRQLSAQSLQLLNNKDLIAIDQDTLGRQAVTVFKQNGIQVLKKELAGGRMAICVLNRSDSLQSGQLSLGRDLASSGTFARCHLIFGQKNITAGRMLAYKLAPHACEVYVFTQP